MIIGKDLRKEFLRYMNAKTFEPFFICGDSSHILREVPSNSIDFCMTSPPYWGQRQYHAGGIGLEDSPHEYIGKLSSICQEVQRVLKPAGSFWLNIGDSYENKGLLGLPWRVAITLTEEQGWILRNSVIWHKVKGGPDNTKDRLRNVHENLFHFVKQRKGYYYNVDAIRSKPKTARILNGAVVSATGVTGVRYKRQIERSAELTSEEKTLAGKALDEMISAMERGEISDFRMIIRGQQRTTHSDSGRVSGRARELADKGFYFLKYHPKGSKPSDVWDILPEDTQKRSKHYAAFP